MNELAQFLGYISKVFHFGRLARSERCSRSSPNIPTASLFVSLLLGAVLRAGSYLEISQQSKRRRWQHLIGWQQRLSEDAFYYVSERFSVADLRQNLVAVNQTLKANNVLESCKIHGLLFLSLDANEHFHSRSRCCPGCCQRELEETDAHGQKQKVTEYYHRYVFGQINGPKFNPLLDLEPIRPGEGEAGAALRLLGRVRRLYGVRFFDAITVDSWYVQGPFLKAVEKLGWDFERAEPPLLQKPAGHAGIGQQPAEIRTPAFFATIRRCLPARPESRLWGNRFMAAMALSHAVETCNGFGVSRRRQLNGPSDFL